MIKTSRREDIERKLEQARRLVNVVSDPTTVERLTMFRNELAECLRRFPGRRAAVSEDQIRARAREMWERHGRPSGRDEEFWLRAERELVEAAKNS